MLTQKRLKELLHYDPETGIFIWKISPNNFIKKGARAGSINDGGYVLIGVDNETYRAHRLAFLYMVGYFPENDVDHVNGICDDNRWSKIRHASRSCNIQNQKKRSDNKSGIPGVSWDKNLRKWRADIKANGKTLYIGISESLLEAALTRFSAEVQCPYWTCNLRSELVKAIKKLWPSFNPQVTT